MSDASIARKTALVGIGTSDFNYLYRNLDPERTREELAVLALKEALDDAGLDKSDIDGLVVGGSPGVPLLHVPGGSPGRPLSRPLPHCGAPLPHRSRAGRHGHRARHVQLRRHVQLGQFPLGGQVFWGAVGGDRRSVRLRLRDGLTRGLLLPGLHALPAALWRHRGGVGRYRRRHPETRFHEPPGRHAETPSPSTIT